MTHDQRPVTDPTEPAGHGPNPALAHDDRRDLTRALLAGLHNGQRLGPRRTPGTPTGLGCAEILEFSDRGTITLIDPDHPEAPPRAYRLALLPAVRSCRICSCTDDNCLACVQATGLACWWVADDLCSRCYMDATFGTARPGADQLGRLAYDAWATWRYWQPESPDLPDFADLTAADWEGWAQVGLALFTAVATWYRHRTAQHGTAAQAAVDIAAASGASTQDVAELIDALSRDGDRGRVTLLPRSRDDRPGDSYTAWADAMRELAKRGGHPAPTDDDLRQLSAAMRGIAADLTKQVAAEPCGHYVLGPDDGSGAGGLCAVPRANHTTGRGLIPHPWEKPWMHPDAKPAYLPADQTGQQAVTAGTAYLRDQAQRNRGGNRP